MQRQRTEPKPVDELRPRVRSRLDDTPEVLLCLDFDGTLAPIVDDPGEAAPTERVEDALDEIAAEPEVTTAIVSGRALADVRERVDGPRIYAGNHGIELERGGSVAVHPIARKRAARIDEVCEALRVALDPVPNARVENKRLTATVHFRSVPEPARPQVERLTRETVARFGGDGLELSDGKAILEIGPAIDWGKGNAVELLVADRDDGTLPVYVGDDVTDESAFRAVEPDGIGIRVGDDAPTAASGRVRSPEGVAELLEWLATDGLERVRAGPNGPP
ncbi:trehalose-phosphatase [Natronococcus jeotgali]|uniref:Trehalose 6-phosphate phosphatase n=1 Tax=Natronococcus jeotgali DSM 18795 TaxID=1227498 RepID=L9X3I1_9EURY|nr:trehalose-phosphatase [Natronococcus jeotgali]ELY55138.1 trehalose-phosphatase [Natronococcus jeotgali DSM 18795]